jgi:hypothetical protein
MRNYGVVFAWLLAACQSPAALNQPIQNKYGAFAFDPPAIYREWWQQVESCSGKSGDFETVRWFERTFSDFLPGTTAGAVSDYATQVIVVAGNRKLEANIIRHEALHLLLKTPGHPAEYFASGPCANLVE